jgi:hypothetical protein
MISGRLKNSENISKLGNKLTKQSKLEDCLSWRSKRESHWLLSKVNLIKSWRGKKSSRKI